MKKLIYSMLLALPFITMACSDNEMTDGDGTLYLSVGIKDNLKVTTRTLTDEETDALKANCRIRVYDGDVLIRKYEGLDNVPSDGLQLVSGSNYSVSATAGDSVTASFTERYFKGSESFAITKGSATNVTVECKIVNTVVKVIFSDKIAEDFADYKLEVGPTSKNMLEFNSTTADSNGYYNLPTDSTSLYWTFTGTTKAGSTVSRNGAITNVTASTLYTISCDFTETVVETGGGIISINVDTTPLEENTSSVTLFQRPAITAFDGNNEAVDITSPTYLKPQESKAVNIWIATSCKLTSAVLSCSKFTEWGLTSNSINLSELSSSEISELNAQGLTVTDKSSTGKGYLGARFTETLFEKITAGEGSYTISITAIDEKNNQRSIDWRIIVSANGEGSTDPGTDSENPVVTSQVSDGYVWSTKATLSGAIAEDAEGTPTFQYRRTGAATRATDWTSVDATRNGNTISAEITGLIPNSTYEYRAVLNGEPSSVVCSFTTEKQAQPENASFEYWGTGSDKAVVPYADGQEMWWDTGNHGSITMNKNITNSSTSYVHSGSYSAQLSSQFVGISIIGKFAAGNIFTGKYLKTDGTDGVLGWGRPFASRPVKLKGYVRYECATVAYTSSSLSNLSKGDNDNGQIYIALGDWAGEEYDGETWPVIIKTKSSERQLFDANASGVIAYGEKTFTESTSGDGLIEFTIDIDYRSLTRRPTSIIIVASASKYGDYFAGGSSKMWIDDLELVYE